MAKAKCEPLQGNPMRSCMTDARTARTEVLALAKTQWNNQGETNATHGERRAERFNWIDTSNELKRVTANSSGSQQAWSFPMK